MSFSMDVSGRSTDSSFLPLPTSRQTNVKKCIFVSFYGYICVIMHCR